MMRNGLMEADTNKMQLVGNGSRLKFNHNPKLREFSRVPTPALDSQALQKERSGLLARRWWLHNVGLPEYSSTYCAPFEVSSTTWQMSPPELLPLSDTCHSCAWKNNAFNG